MNNTSPQRYDNRDYDTSFGDGVLQSMKVSIVLSFLFSIFSLVSGNEMSVIEAVGKFIGLFLSLGFVSSIITLAVTFIFAYPVAIILRYFKLDSEINGGLVGGLLVFSSLMWMSMGSFISLYYVMVFWGMACGYAFMRGYNKGEK